MTGRSDFLRTWIEERENHALVPSVEKGRCKDVFLPALGERHVRFEGKADMAYRWAEGQYDRLPGLAVDLVRRPVSAIVAKTPAVPTVKAPLNQFYLILTVILSDTTGGLNG